MMSVATTSAPSPGWYPDPHGPEGLRWWNGRSWTDDTTPLPAAAPAAPAFVATAPGPAFVATAAAPSFTPDLELPPRVERFSTGFTRDATSFTLELPEEDFGPAGPPPVRFCFRSREAVLDDPVAVPRSAAMPPPPPPAAAPEPDLLFEDEDEDIEILDAEVVDDRPAFELPSFAIPDLAVLRALPRRKTAAAVAVAASAALLSNLIGGNETQSKAKGAASPPAAVASAAKDCLKLWNTGDTANASAQRITLGQFAGALARVGHVAPLAGTLMQPNSCGLTVYDAGTDTNAVFVAGVKDQTGYLDVTAYPRAAKQYGWPKTAAQANVTIQADGTIVAK